MISNIFYGDNNYIKINKRKHLYFISFLKFLAMIFIIKWHTLSRIPYEQRPIDLGARMCEFLFVCSGFLVGYNHYQNPMPASFHQSFKYSYKRFRIFYPLEFLNIILIFFLDVKNNLKTINLTEIELFIANIFMLKCWGSSNVSFSFNGPSWFLGSLLFCYLMTPLLLCGNKNFNRSFILFFLISVIRVGIDEFIKHGATNFFHIDFHVGPIIRCMEFYLGMLMNPLFFKIKYYCDKMSHKNLFRILFTIIQFSLPLGFYIFLLKYDKFILRCYFVLLFNFFTLIMALDYGYLSNLFSMQFFNKIFSNQLEMFLFQGLVFKIIKKIDADDKWKNNDINLIIILIILFILSLVYKFLLKSTLTNILDKFVNLIEKV